MLRLLSVLLLFAGPLRATPALDVLARFETQPINVVEGLIAGPEGKFYGVSYSGGAYDRGTLFRVDDGGRMELLAVFADDSPLGIRPVHGLVRGGDGAIYGCTQPSPQKAGTIFRYTPETGCLVAVTYESAGLPGSNIRAGLSVGSDGAVYSMSSQGVFRLLPEGGTTLVSAFATPVTTPYAQLPLSLGSDGAWYGFIGSPYETGGTLFRAAPGAPAEVLARLGTGVGEIPTHIMVGQTMVLGSDGALYSYMGKALYQGAIVRIGTDRSVAIVGEVSDNNGGGSGLAVGPGGHLYGTTRAGGDAGRGSVFRYAVGEGVTILKSFTDAAGALPGPPDGTRLHRLPDGRLLGLTSPERTHSETYRGIVYEIGLDQQVRMLSFLTAVGPAISGTTLAPSGVFDASGRLLACTTGFRYDYNYQREGDRPLYRIDPDGTSTAISLLIQSSPTLPGTIGVGPIHVTDTGTVYLGSMRQDSSYNNPYLTALDADGSARVLFPPVTLSPFTRAALAPPSAARPDGRRYGFSADFEPPFAYRLTDDGEITILARFTGEGGALPGGYVPNALHSGGDGALYGIAAGYYTSFTTIFRISPNDEVTNVAQFTGEGTTPGPGGLTQLSSHPNGAIYGTTHSGGASGCGVVFRYVPGVGLKTLSHFTGISGGQPGKGPLGLTLGDDGNFYGLTSLGGASDLGTVFRCTPDGVVTSLAAFSGAGGTLPGQHPQPLLCPGPGGWLYGTTYRGTILRVHTDGTVQYLGNGGEYINLVRRGDEAVYGGTPFGGAHGAGLIFRIAPSGAVTKVVDLPGPTRPPFSGLRSIEFAVASDGALLVLSPFGSPGTVVRQTPPEEYPGASGTLYRLNFSPAQAQDDVVELTATPFEVRGNDNLDFVDSAIVTGLTQPANGTATLLADQRVQYTPGATFAGTDTFTYTLRDGTGAITTATVTVRDTQPPSFTTPAARTLAVDDSGKLALPDLRAELGAADLGGINLIQQSPAPGTIRGPGAHPVSFEIADRAGNTATTSTVLTLADQTNPTITLPPTVFADLVTPQLIPDLSPFAIAKDNDGIAQLTQNPAAGTVAAGDRVSVVVRATDLAGNFAEATCNVVFRSGDLAVPTTVLDRAGKSHDLRVCGPPAINATGSIAFRGQFGAGRQGIFEFASADQPTALVLSGDTAPGTKGRFATFSDPAWNESNHVAFRASLRPGIGGVSAADDTGIWVAGASGAGRLVAREGDRAFGRARFTRFETLALLPGDRVIFVATIADDSSATARRGIWMEVDGGPELVLLEGELPPGGGDRVRSFQFLSPTPGLAGQTRSFLPDGRLAVSHRKTREQQTISVLSPAALGFKGDCYVSTPGTLSPLGTVWQRLGEPAIAEDGALAFRAECGADPTATLPGIFAIDSLSATRAVASAGNPAPGLTGATFADFGAPVIVDEDTLAFSARLAGTDATGNQSLWSSSAAGLSLVARAGDPAPGATDYTFAAFPSFAQRANGRLLFLAKLQRPGTRPVRAVYAETPTGLELIAREGGELDYEGSARRVTALDFLPTLPVVAGQTRSFGTSDHLVFRATLEQVRTPVLFRRKLAP